jgi:glycosyltransferase involved in cell wall biosynthesis
MRILQLIPDIGVGGAERMMVHLACELARKHDVAVLSLFPAKENELEAQLKASGVEIVYLGKKLGLDVRMYLRLFRTIRRLKPDIAHTHRYVLRYALPALLAESGCRVVHTVHNVAEREVGWTGRAVHRVAFRSGVMPVAIGRAVADSFERVYGRAPRAIVPHGIPVGRYQSSNDTRRAWRREQRLDEVAIVFGCVARLAPQKNLALLLEAFAFTVGKSPNAMLLLAGEGPERERLEGRARELGLGARVRFIGLREDVPELLSAIDVFVLSSNWEGNPLSVMEAMAAGKPVISTAVGGVPEFVTDGLTGLLTPAGDSGSLAAAMTTLANNESTRVRMGEEGARRAARDFDVAVMTARYEELYMELRRTV